MNQTYSNLLAEIASTPHVIRNQPLDSLRWLTDYAGQATPSAHKINAIIDMCRELRGDEYPNASELSKPEDYEPITESEKAAFESVRIYLKGNE
jgi:hypothetical protein